MAGSVFDRLRRLGPELLRGAENTARMAAVPDDVGSAVPDSGAMGGTGAGPVDRLHYPGGRRHLGIGPRAPARRMDHLGFIDGRRRGSFRGVRLGLALHRGRRLSTLVSVAAILGRRGRRNDRGGADALASAAPLGRESSWDGGLQPCITGGGERHADLYPPSFAPK